MATDATWNGTTDASDFTATTDPPWVGGIVPTSGGTITITTVKEPTAHLPTTGTYHFSVATGIWPSIGSWVNGAKVGNVTINHGSASPTCYSNITGNLVISAGNLGVAATVTGTTTVAAGATLTSWTSTYTGAVTIAGSLVVPSTYTATFTAGLTLSGSLTLTGAAALAGPVALRGTVNLLSKWALAGQAVNLGTATILASGRTLNGATATSITSSGAIIQGGITVATINNMTAGTGRIWARRWTGTGNGTVVKTLAPHYALGMR